MNRRSPRDVARAACPKNRASLTKPPTRRQTKNSREQARLWLRERYLCMKSLLRTLQFVAQFITLGLALAFVVSLFAPQSVERLRAALQPSAPVEAPESGPSARAAVAPAASTP